MPGRLAFKIGSRALPRDDQRHLSLERGKQSDIADELDRVAETLFLIDEQSLAADVFPAPSRRQLSEMLLCLKSGFRRRCSYSSQPRSKSPKRRRVCA